MSKATPPENIFVFGSNLAGRHGKGAALYAKNRYGAEYGTGIGLTGRSYAIPTKGFKMEVLPLKAVRTYVDEFLRFASDNPQYRFFTTRIGCGLAGGSDKDMAALFRKRPGNVYICGAWMEILGELDAPRVCVAGFAPEPNKTACLHHLDRLLPSLIEAGATLVCAKTGKFESLVQSWAMENMLPLKVIPEYFTADSEVDREARRHLLSWYSTRAIAFVQGDRDEHKAFVDYCKGWLSVETIEI